MTHSSTFSSLGSEFDAFLFAPIGEEENGMLLSVVSALARLDLDPWREAAELARMPKETARRKLTSLIEALPKGALPRPDPATISGGLIALLPRGANSSRGTSSSIVLSETFPSTGAVINSRAFILVILINALFLVGMMSAHWASASLHPSAPAHSAQASSASEISMTDKQTPPNANDRFEQRKP
jgi:hypothetical protein